MKNLSIIYGQVDNLWHKKFLKGLPHLFTDTPTYPRKADRHAWENSNVDSPPLNYPKQLKLLISMSLTAGVGI